MFNDIRGKTPEIYCSVVTVFNTDTNIIDFVRFLNENGVQDVKIVRPKLYNCVDVNFAIVNNEFFWDLDDALTKMFSHIDHFLGELKEKVALLSGRIVVDITFYKYETYPALHFRGKNMKKIHFLNADISIDPYSMGSENAE